MAIQKEYSLAAYAAKELMKQPIHSLIDQKNRHNFSISVISGLFRGTYR